MTEKRIGPWIITDTIYDRSGVSIHATSSPSWVVKQTNDKSEVQIAISVSLVGPRHAVEFPPDPDYFYGVSWYAMRRYTGHVLDDTFCRLRWRTLAIHVLQFLQDFHHGLGLVHGDIKKANILVSQAGSFVVCDYEFAQRPVPEPLLCDSDDLRWYYISFGLEMEGPRLSWRGDLVSLGYILASLTVNPSQWTFEQECWLRREGICNSLTEDEVVALRDSEVGLAHPTVVAYLEMLKTIPWRSDDPPPRSFYEGLEDLFT